MVGGDDILNGMLVNDEDVGLSTDHAKRSSARRKELVIYACSDLVCVLIFGCKKVASDQKFMYSPGL